MSISNTSHTAPKKGLLAPRKEFSVEPKASCSKLNSLEGRERERKQFCSSFPPNETNLHRTSFWTSEKHQQWMKCPIIWCCVMRWRLETGLRHCCLGRNLRNKWKDQSDWFLLRRYWAVSCRLVVNVQTAQGVDWESYLTYCWHARSRWIYLCQWE